jgi:photosystem II oxygen-evolving enhancer protein 3
MDQHDHEMEQKGCLCRIKNCAIELLSMEEDLETDDEESWDLVGRDLRLKATFLCIDLSRLIAFCQGEEHKKALTVVANKFFYSMDEVSEESSTRPSTSFFFRTACLGPLHQVFFVFVFFRMCIKSSFGTQLRTATPRQN